MDRLAARTLERFGAVHVVCNNAGVGGGGPMWELSTRDWEWVLRPNLWGVIHGVRVFVPHLVEQDEGHVVNTASMAGLVSIPNLGPYNVTKHAVVTLSETLYGDLKQAGKNVGVSVLCPGFVNTRIFDSQRNRPAALRNPGPEPDEAALAERNRMAQEFLSRAMPPAEVAARVHDAIVNDRFWVLTHAGSEKGVEARLRTVLEGRNPEVGSPLDAFSENPS